jgi:SAM-dependent methyltransferase
MAPENPLALRRTPKRFLCTFLPWLVIPQRGATRPGHWDSHSTEPFSKPDPAGLVLMNEVIELCPDRNAPILDMGCNVGRYMNHLFGHGYRNLHGVDFSGKAIEQMAQIHPEMRQASTVSVAPFQEYLTGNPPQMDVIYTYGATFELVHPSFPLVERVCRIARRYIVLVIAEAGHAYPRFWEYEFARQGFELSHLRRPASVAVPKQKSSLMTFRRLGA